MRAVKIVWNRNGYTEVRKSPGVAADLERRARAIARTAGPGMEVSSRIGRTRARSSVFTATTEARLAEANDRALTRSLGAGRG